MPLVEITVPAGSVPPESIGSLQRNVAGSVLKWMGLPDTDFFTSATWVHVHEIPAERASTGRAGTDPGFVVVVTAIEGFLTPERNEALSAEVTRHVLTAASLPAEKAASVWTIVREVPEGFWSVGGNITRRSKLDALIKAESGAPPG